MFSLLAAAAAIVAVFIQPEAVVGGRTAPVVRFTVKGRVFCDTCRAGFETPATTYLQGAKVRVECRGGAAAKLCSYDGVTDHSGTYNIFVADEHEHETCEVRLVSSPDESCNTEVLGREKAPVFLSHNNGIASDTRLANALGYQKNSPQSFCAELMKQYQQDEV